MTLPEAIADGLQALVAIPGDSTHERHVQAILNTAIAFLRGLKEERKNDLDDRVRDFVEPRLEAATQQRAATDAKRADNEAFYRGELDAIHRAAVLVLVDDFETTLRECSLKQALERLRNRIRHVPPVTMNVDPKDTRPVVECVPLPELAKALLELGDLRDTSANVSWRAGWLAAIAAVQAVIARIPGMRLA